jgi:hypothetical protein
MGKITNGSTDQWSNDSGHRRADPEVVHSGCEQLDAGVVDGVHRSAISPTD